ncbi:hypothetical protein B0H19DRAFT_1055894 [Mycena capillaripes]|nr:hypothetical protein B0H19DRAFT_1055894 [Mycena capillaripes]
MGTSSLWCVVNLKAHLWAGPAGRKRTMNVLRPCLDRGWLSPLDLGLQLQASISPDSAALSVLAEYSQRWRKISISVDHTRALKAVSVVKDGIECHDKVIDSEIMSLFAVAPVLTEIWYHGPVAALSKLPLEKMQWFVYLDVLPQALDELISMMSRLSDERAYGRNKLANCTAYCAHDKMAAKRKIPRV